MRTTNQTNGITAIYVRRSVSDSFKGNNSLSINAQKEECIRFVGDAPYQVYCDDGRSGKDIEHRPVFQQMMSDAREGIIGRICFSRTLRLHKNTNFTAFSNAEFNLNVFAVM